ncbi:MAG: hypothetical protein LBU95_03705, partial [Rikenellaceae bacterium]|nr:hypothetical protein [Rikenellaceae bacterium]
MKRKLLLVILLAAGLHAGAQELLWDLKLDWRFDNREYKSEINWPQTLFGARLTPQIGIGWDGCHSIMVGTDLMADFGATAFTTEPDWIAYYGYKSPRLKAYAGVFPRDKMMGYYNSAFFSDSVKYYDSNLEGLLLQYHSLNKRWLAEVGCDWNSMLGEEQREKFMIFYNGEYRARWFDAGMSCDMYHHAGTLEEDGVIDNILQNFYATLKVRELLPRWKMQECYLRLGWFQGEQNYREE